MTITDPVQLWLESTYAIIDADLELRTLFGRNADLCLPWNDFTLDGPVPVIALQLVDSTPLGNTDRQVVLQCSVFAQLQSVCNKAVQQLETIVLRYPTYAGAGIQVGRDPSTPPRRRWPGGEARQDESAVCRADLDVAFLIAG